MNPGASQILHVRLMALRRAYIAVATYERGRWNKLHDDLNRLLHTARTRADDTGFEFLEKICEHAGAAVAIYGRRPSMRREELQAEIRNLTKTLSSMHDK